VLVMREGRLSGELSRPTTQEEIMRLAAPIHSAAETVQ
jgi:hypothetical protein